MAVWRFVDFSVRETQNLADLASIEVDLKTTEQICDLFLKKGEQAYQSGDPEAFILIEALCAAAIVRYGRSFVSGVRQQVPSELVEQLSQKDQESHTFFMVLRHKWVAHSVNGFEETQVVAYLTPEEVGPKSISSISVQTNRVTCLSMQDMLRLKNLATTVRGEVKRLIESENQKVLRYARSLPPDQFYSQLDPPRRLFADNDAGKVRKKLERKQHLD